MKEKTATPLQLTHEEEIMQWANGEHNHPQIRPLKTADPSPLGTLVLEIELFLRRYVTFAEPHYTLPLALWTLGTFVFQRFGVFPYLVITSDTKRAGKTRLAELLSFVCAKPRSLSAITPAVMFHAIDTEEPTLFIEEAEQLASESATDLRAVINVGYRKGQMVPRMVGSDVKEFKTFCPKVFILIGKPFDTLLDRSIIVKMRRAEAPERFLYDAVKPAGEKLRGAIKAALDEKDPAGQILLADLSEHYANHTGLAFLSDRDEEIWGPLFSICAIACPKRLDELTAAATDISTEKTDTTIKHRKELRSAEARAQEEEYSARLLANCHQLIAALPSRKPQRGQTAARVISTADLLDALHHESTFPWRKYQGTGLTAHTLSSMLSSRGVRPSNIRTAGGRKGSKVFKGYKLESFKRALEKK